MDDGQLVEGSLLNDRYRIIRVIGQGGMGTVYQAEHERLTAIVAVKEIRGTPSTGTAQQATMEQYEQEARFLVRLNHPNLPKVTDAFVDSNRFYLVMDFVDGVTLENRLRTRGGSPMDPETVVDWAVEIADVLGYLHSQDPPIIFRDLKPSNVMVQQDGHIKLIDFGIARRFQPGASQDTALLGSVGYSPPEQFGKHQTDKRSDIYSLGATMHHLLTARDPSSTPFKFAPIDKVAIGIPISLVRLIARCLAIEPENRPQNAEVLSTELWSIHDELHHIGIPTRGTAEETGRRIASTKLSDSQRAQSKRLGSGRVTTDDAIGGSIASPGEGKLRAAVAVLGVVLVCIVSFAVHAAIGRTKTTTRTLPRVLPEVVPGPAASSGASDVGGKQNAGVAPPTSGGAQGTTTAPPDPSSSGDTTTPPGDAKAAEINAEVVGASPDGKSVRLHVTGQINGKKDTAGMVAAYFYNADKTPLLAKDPKGAYATPTGQLFAEFTFQIDADSKPIDGLIDVPADQFTVTNNLLFKCIVYADNQSAGQTDLAPLSGSAN